MINVIRGNIWSHLGSPIVVPTNIGWTKTGENVMGRGVAQQAARRYPLLPKIYGEYCQQRKFYAHTWPFIMVEDQQVLIMFPVKPLRPKAPQFSWSQPASLSLIRKSAYNLAALADTHDVVRSASAIYLPLVGCGNGGLSRGVVLPVLGEILDDRFVLVEL